MSRMIRSRRADASRDLPLYGRMLGLRHLAPSGFLCFVFLEGAVALGILLALAELVTWWGVLVLPLTVAVMVKLNDVVAGALIRPAGGSGPQTARGARPAGAGTVTPPPPMLRPAVIPRVTADEFGVDDRSLAGARTVDLRERAIGRPGALPTVTAVEASALNDTPGSRTWADDVDLRQQRARQSAARRYE
jgi:hypothetical protein